KEKHINYLQRIYEKWREENKRVLELGGLHVVGTERHEARRIDNQLRGRSGRQGDPGYSRFYLSLEDDLLRLFGSDRIAPWLTRAGFKEDEPIEHPWITRSIEKAQKRVEGRNFEIRKHLLEYDEVMNMQRRRIYALRDKVLNNDNIKDEFYSILEKFVSQEIEYTAGSARRLDRSQMQEMGNRIIQIFNVDLGMEESGLREELQTEIISKLKAVYERKESEVGAEILREVERMVLLDVIDSKWKRHLYVIDELQEGIGLRSYGEKNPLVEYKLEASKLFNEMLWSLNEEILRILFTAQIKANPKSFDESRDGDRFGGGTAEHQQMSLLGGKALGGKLSKKVGRNELCPCGSGKKYKHCCGR
ncbi:MAG: preprotein translocase subunit SecA, partial [Spirochaetae bacterium HGW-Spirochaetae-6]